MREHTRAPARLTFFLFIYFHTEVRKAIRSMNLLSTFVFPFLCLCVCVYLCTRFLRRVWLLQLFFFLICLLFCGFFFSSVIWFSYFPFCPINNTLSDFLFVRSFYPRFTSHSPFFFSFTFWFYSVFPSPLFPSSRKIIRRHVRVRGIERYEEEGFEGLGGRRVAER